MYLPRVLSCSKVAIFLCLLNPAYAAEFSPKLTEFGHPDLQGNWTSATITPFVRPEELGEKRAYSQQEATELVSKRLAELEDRFAPLEDTSSAPEVVESVDNSAEDQFKEDYSNLLTIDGEVRTSIIVEPSNGRLPLRQNAIENTFDGQWMAAGFKDFDGPEMAGPGPRCLIDFGALPPAGPIVPISPNFKFVQTEHYVVLYIEAGAELRVIRLNSEYKPIPGGRWRGDSIGEWQGGTLVVHTNNFNPQSSAPQLRMSELLEVEEQFTPISDSEIFYRFTATDPNVYTQPFSGELILSRMPEGEKIFDYACHEGNYSLPGILAGARRQDVYSAD